MEGEGLCECGYKSSHPEGPFCPKCGSQLFLRRPISQPAPSVAAEAEAWRHGHRHDGQYQDLSSRSASVDVDGRLTTAGAIPPTQIAAINSLPEESQIRLRFGDRRVSYARVRLASEAVSNSTEVTIPPTLPPRPAADFEVPDSQSDSIQAGLQHRATPPIKREESPPPFWEIAPLARIRDGERSRSPRRQEVSERVVERFPAGASSHQPASAAHSRYRSALRESTGANTQPVRRRRNFRGRQSSKAKASRQGGMREPVVDNGLQAETLARPQQSGGRLQQSLPMTPVGQERRPLCGGGHLQPEHQALQIQNSQGSVVDEGRSGLDAAIQQLLDEEGAAVDSGISQGNTDEILHDGQARLLVDDGLLRGNTTSRKGEVHGGPIASNVGPQPNDGTRRLQEPLSAPSSEVQQVGPEAPSREQVDNQHLWCLRCHRRGHSMHATCADRTARPTLRVERDWAAYYQKENVAAVPGITTVNQVINVAYRLGVQFNKFDAFMKERDAYLLEVGQYLEPRISTASYEVWHTCRNTCNITVDRYMAGLLHMLKALQYHVVLKPVFQAARAANSIVVFSHKRHLGEFSPEEQAELLRLTRARHNSIQIDEKSYAISLKTLNSERDAYKRHCDAAVTKIRDTLKNNREAQQSQKIRTAFSCLFMTMLDVGGRAKLNLISPADFPLPDVRRLREDWNALDEREK